MSKEIDFEDEYISEKDLKKYKEVQTKLKAHKRRLNKFWKTVDANRETVIEYLNLQTQDTENTKPKIDPRLEKVLEVYGCSADEFFSYVLSDQQVGYYHRYHK